MSELLLQVKSLGTRQHFCCFIKEYKCGINFRDCESTQKGSALTTFENIGSENTEQTIRLACKRAKELNIDELVLASTSGKSALLAREICKDMKIVAVTYHAGAKSPFEMATTAEERAELAEKGIELVCCGHALSGVERGIAKKFPGPYPVLIMAETLRMFGQGTKVAVECAIMAADSGYLSGKTIMSLGGSAKGLDTALVLKPANMNAVFDIKIHEIVCKPSLM